MFGWRGRLGAIIPSQNTTVEPEFSSFVPDGVSVHANRVPIYDDPTDERLTEMNDEMEECAAQLATADVDVVAYACTGGSFFKGAGYETEIEERLSRAVDVPAVATSASIQRAFDALGIRSMVVTTPYTEKYYGLEEDFLLDQGYEVLSVHGLGIDPITEIGRQSPETAYVQALENASTDVDGLFISCTNYRTLTVLPQLEDDLGKPVVTSNQATLWDALRTINVDYSGIELGQLFRCG